MLPHKHAIISTAIGAIGWWMTKDIKAGVAAVAAGVLPDLDHIADYVYYRARGTHRLILPLHGYEYAVFGAIAALRADSRILGIAALSYLVHLLADQMENRTHPLGYFVLFRVWRRFRIEDISSVPEYAALGREEDMRLLTSLFHRLRTLF
jgi:hypothetical protein